MKIGAAAEADGSVRVGEGQVRLEAANIRRVNKARVADVRLYVAGKLVHSNGVEIGNAEARAAFATAAQAELAGGNGAAIGDLPGLLLALDEAVHRDAAARRGKRPSDARPTLDADDGDLARALA